MLQFTGSSKSYTYNYKKFNLINRILKVEEAFKVVESLTTVYDQPTSPNPNNLKDYEYLSDVDIFNRVMFEVAKSGKVSRLYVLFRKMRTNKGRPVMPNLNSYAAVLQAYGYRIENQIVDEAADRHVMAATGGQMNSSRDEVAKNLALIRLGVERVVWDIKKANVCEIFCFIVKKPT